MGCWARSSCWKESLDTVLTDVLYDLGSLLPLLTTVSDILVPGGYSRMFQELLDRQVTTCLQKIDDYYRLVRSVAKTKEYSIQASTYS
jgi:predicted TPR repeat methyltransferase